MAASWHQRKSSMAQNDAMGGIIGFRHTNRRRSDATAIAGSSSFLNI
jgi:hypothetical protein